MKSKALISFYNSYHQKNGVYSKPITDGNFTYFYFIKYFKKHYKGTKSGCVLDIGCGVGSISFYLASKGMDVVGIDVSTRAIELCKKVAKNIGLKNVSFKRKTLDDQLEKNDVVVCSEIIEHIKDDAEFAVMLGKKLKKNAYLFLSTPSKDNVFYPLGVFAKFDAEVGHLRRYTAESLTSVLEHHGFTIEAIYPIEGVLRNILFTTKLGFIIRFIRGPLVPIFHAIDAVFISLLGPCNYFVVARKK
ncbi:methyltransferase domain-containing protein [Candidatus Woesebacteria bacterium]|nr:methyltransferase domain-containing protein [Candidatus Woesebacteria bacterium]